VLLGEDRRRTEDERLLPVQGGGEGGSYGDLGLPETDVAADEAVHRPRRLEVFLHRLDRLLLVVRFPVRERCLEPLDPVASDVEGEARGLLAARVQGEELAGELADGRPRSGLQVLPGLPAELGERWRLRVGADVAADLGKLLVRDVEPVFTAKGEEEVVTRDTRDLPRLEPDQAADAVVLVDDEVPRAQIRERLKSAAEPCVRPRRPLPEDLDVRQQREAEVAPDEAAARRADDEPHRGISRERAVVLDDFRIDLSEHALGAQRVAEAREGDEDAPALPHHALELALGLCETTGRDRRTLRLERVRLRSRERIELSRARERDRLEPFVRPHSLHVVRLPDEVGRPFERGDEIDRRVLQVEVDEISPSLGRRLDHRLGDRVQRALRERRERAHLLDLVSEELDA
jgi:hypothetical protein